jgi:small subunit ribosomal protein S5e
MSATTLPKDISKLGQEIKLFGKWDTQESVSLFARSTLADPSKFSFSACSVEVKDISLTDYIQTRNAVYLPHTAGRYAKKQFKKAQMPIVERLVDRSVSGGARTRTGRSYNYFVQPDDEGAQQRQEAPRRPHCRARL